MTSNQPDRLPEDILIIDDTLLSLRGLMAALRENGYTVRGVPSGALALQMVAADPPDLILLDSRMPEMDGYDVCRRLKADEKTAVIPVIFVSAMSSLDDKMEGFAVGAVDYISKPFQIEEVLARVKTQLSLHRLQRDLEIQNKLLQHEIAKRHRAEAALKDENKVLERRVERRARALTLANACLTAEATERERAESALGRSEMQYRSLFETLPVGVVVVGDDGRTRTINSALSEMLGYSLEEMRAYDLNPNKHPMQNSMRMFHAELMQKGTVHGYEMDIEAKDGRILSVRMNADTLALKDETTLLVTLDDITEQKRIERARHESDEKFFTIVANTEAILFMVDRNGLFTLSEGRGLASLGVEPGQMVGLSTYKIYKEFPSIIAGFEMALAGTASRGTIYIEDVWFDVWYSPYRDASGDVLGVIGMALDITEQREQQKQLRQLSQAVEQSPAIIIIIDLDGDIEYTNPQFSKITGYSADEMLGENLRVLKSDYMTSDEYEELWEMIASGNEWHGEFRSRKKNGELYWESTSISPITDHDGVITHYLAIKEDVTARKRMESALQQRNDELTFINRVSRSMISHLDIEHTLSVLLEEVRAFWDISAGMVWMTEDDSDDLICAQMTEPHQEVVDNWRLPAGSSILGWAIRERKSVVVDDAPRDPRFTPIINYDDYPLHAQLTVPLQSRTGIIGAIQFVDKQVGRFTESNVKMAETLAATAVNAIENARLHQDLQAQFQKLKDTQAQLIQSEKLAAIGELISGIAHELNNPLTSIILYAQLMEAKGVDESVSRDLKQIMTQSHRASNVVHGLLDFARQRPFERVPTQVNDVLQSTIDLLAYELRTHNIKVETDFSTAVPVTLADGHQLQQVFVNLINNALQAMDSRGNGGRLTLTTKYAVSSLVQLTGEKTILIIIQDDGSGIAQKSASRIFDPFFTTKAEGEGTGLGLAVCHRIITDHQGRIWMESEQGHGATFFIELPVITLVEGATAEADIVFNAGDTAEKRILVVDDESSILMIMTRILHRNGFSVDGVKSGTAAWAHLQQGQYDLIISDLRMPEMSGQELYRRTVEKYPEYNGRFIFTTGDAINSDLRAFLEINHIPALEKPFEMEELIYVVMKMLL